MFWARQTSGLEDAGAAARREHSTWLTRMLTARVQPARIPIAPVDTGGFTRLMAGSAGRAWAEAWWESALGPDSGEDA